MTSIHPHFDSMEWLYMSGYAFSKHYENASSTPHSRSKHVATEIYILKERQHLRSILRKAQAGIRATEAKAIRQRHINRPLLLSQCNVVAAILLARRIQILEIQRGRHNIL